MLLQEFIALWQAQPFRAFRLCTDRGAFAVTYPQGVALSPEMQVLVVTENFQVERIALNDITAAEIFGPPVSIADTLRAVNPDTLAQHLELLTAAMNRTTARPKKKPAPRFDSGRVSFHGTRAPDGRFVVQASVTTRDDAPMFTTAGTRWNVHGTEKFDNGTSLYLHHLDHPTEEQRVILWPPDTGTFDTFAEAQPLARLMQDLRQRDARLSAKPAKALTPPASYFRESHVDYPPPPPRDGRAEAFGAGPDDTDFDRFELHLVPHKTTAGNTVKNPCLVDVPAEDFMFNLTKTEWDATWRREGNRFVLTLQQPGLGQSTLTLVLNPDEHTARLVDEKNEWPMTFVERQLVNFALYENADALLARLRAGPVKARQPDIVVPLSDGFVVEWWSGPARVALPFLQPRLLDPAGATLLDLRATTWAAAILPDSTKPRIGLRLISDEEKKRHAPERLQLTIDLVTHHVTCAGVKGATTLGMIQALLRRVRGLKWLSEELPKWMAKGRALPSPS